MTDALDLIEARLPGAKRKGDTIVAPCPAHDDKNPSLSVSRGTKGRDVALYCHAGCTPDAVMEAIGLKWTDLGPPNGHAESAMVYVYQDAAGRPIYRVHREVPKKFWQDRMTTHGEWASGLGDTPRVLYHLPDVIRAVDDGRTIWVAEGEKDADRLRAEGVTATCNSGGAGKFKDNHADVLTGANVVIVADRDPAGYNHAAEVDTLLRARHCTTRIVRPAHGKDAYDHLAAGLPLEAFVTIDPTTNDPNEEEWPDPIPLGEVMGSMPSFPTEALPPWMQSHVLAVADELQVSVDLPAMLALVALSIIFAGRHKIHVRSTWHEQLNLYAVVALPPGAGKSPAFRAMLGAIGQWEHDEAERLGGQAEHVAQKRRIIEKAMKRAEDKGDTGEAQRQLDDLLNTPEVVVPRLIADDATPEALVDLMARHGGKMALISTEGGPFELMGGRYSDKANLDPYLKAWSGDAIRVDRVGRGPSVIPNPALTIGLTVQPDVVRALADTPQFTGRGLTARFMFAVPASLVGHRNLIDIPATDTGIAARYDRRLLALLASERGAVDTTPVEIDGDARGEFLGWRQGLEHRRRSGADLEQLAEWTTKLESSVARVAGLFALSDERHEVDIPTMRRALAIGAYWLAHAKAVHDMWGTDPTVVTARRVLAWLADKEMGEFSVRDIYRGLHKSEFPTVDDTRAPLNLLTERGWIRPQFTGPLVVGRRGVDSPKFSVHPSNLWISAPVGSHGSDGLKGVSESLSSSPFTDTDTAPRDMAAMAANRLDPFMNPGDLFPPLSATPDDPEFGPFR